jgi:hypothetical protein
MTKKYIDAEELNKLLCEAKSSIPVFNGGICKAKMIVREMPAADVEEVRHGYWDFTSCVALRCSECNEAIMFVMGVYDEARERRKKELQELYKYCPFLRCENG